VRVADEMVEEGAEAWALDLCYSPRLRIRLRFLLIESLGHGRAARHRAKTEGRPDLLPEGAYEST
jgi:hypothetical protein